MRLFTYMYCSYMCNQAMCTLCDIRLHLRVVHRCKEVYELQSGDQGTVCFHPSSHPSQAQTWSQREPMSEGKPSTLHRSLLAT